MSAERFAVLGLLLGQMPLWLNSDPAQGDAPAFARNHAMTFRSHEEAKWAANFCSTTFLGKYDTIHVVSAPSFQRASNRRRLT